jgi:hypothetical protein
MKLAPIDVSIPDISRKDVARHRDLESQQRFDDEELNLLHIDPVELRDDLGGESPALQHAIKALPVLEHDVECQFERTRVLAANQSRELPEFAHSVGMCRDVHNASMVMANGLHGSLSSHTWLMQKR